MFNVFHHYTRGRGHELDGTPCQDRTQYLSCNGVQAICLADGAGSASQAELGAQAVVEEGCALLVERFSELLASADAERTRIELLDRLLSKLRQLATQHRIAPDDLASTFLGVAVAGDHFLGVHIGDGVIGYLKDDELRVVSAPRNSEFVNQTTFLTSQNAAQSMRLFRGSLDGVGGFILMSDGAGESLFDARSGQFAPACSKIIATVGAGVPRRNGNFKFRTQLQKLIDLQVRSATKDDCSIAVLGRTVP